MEDHLIHSLVIVTGQTLMLRILIVARLVLDFVTLSVLVRLERSV